MGFLLAATNDVIEAIRMVDSEPGEENKKGELNTSPKNLSANSGSPPRTSERSCLVSFCCGRFASWSTARADDRAVCCRGILFGCVTLFAPSNKRILKSPDWTKRQGKKNGEATKKHIPLQELFLVLAIFCNKNCLLCGVTMKKS